MKGSTVLQFLTLLVCIGVLYYTYENTKQIETLRQENQVLWEKLDSVQVASQKAPAPSRKGSAAPAKSSSLLDAIVSDLEKDYREMQRESKKNAPKVSVSSSYRLEDRYTSCVWNPDYVGDAEGTVTLDILVTRLGDVSSAKLSSATISDEEVIEACKKAALQTDFNYISTAPDSQAGTITYTFKKK